MKNKYLIWLMAAIVMVVVIALVIKRISKKNGKNQLGEYDFYQGKDSAGGDLIYNPSLAGNIEKMSEICSLFSQCKGFNSAGYFKGSIKPLNDLNQYNVSDSKAGLYVKK